MSPAIRPPMRARTRFPHLVGATPSAAGRPSLAGSVANAVSTALLVASTLALALTLLVVTGGAASAAPPEDYATWEPADKCAPKAKAGAVVLGEKLEKRFGGTLGGISRRCGRDGVSSEHEEGRAVDWTLDAGSKTDRQAAKKFLAFAFQSDRKERPHAKARRMGIMYIIWKDRIYSAWHGFESRPYLHSACSDKASCSVTLRHRDHMHISLTREAAAGRTSWYAGRL